MHAISNYHGNRPTNKHRPPQTGPITIHSAANLSRYGLLTEDYIVAENVIYIFPGEPRLAGFIGAKDGGGGGDSWSYKSCKAPVKSSLPTNQHPVFYRPDVLPVAQPTVSKHWRENVIDVM